ncbi:hypothetical protein HOG17_03950 [Candidatus Peregrinibacteria bacterium]|nr:hypothetical protein [Candidatus Peregrinibacteria bacterium]MBT4148357.1 hypothetical protein [Candidatus Peregrinibacteria bacterium]MBT4366676.1 hypothetical protein [Candidatus Peregrinibacteria bacterium]MBT4455890.1 hypothetical protein [Candidatus Peregrinibacteria bacterium]
MVRENTMLLVMVLLFSGCNFSFGEDEEVLAEVEIVEEEEINNDLSVYDVDDAYIESYDDDWNVYRDVENHYSLKIPKVDSVYDCNVADDVDFPVTVLRDGNVAFVTSETRFFYGTYLFEDCSELEVTKIPNDKKVPWKIVASVVKNMEDLELFVKEMYGEDCTIGHVDEDGDVYVDTFNFDSGCFLNNKDIKVMKYNEAAERAYSFIVQEDNPKWYGTFLLKTDAGMENLDLLMLDSFTFWE